MGLTHGPVRLQQIQTNCTTNSLKPLHQCTDIEIQKCKINRPPCHFPKFYLSTQVYLFTKNLPFCWAQRLSTVPAIMSFLKSERYLLELLCPFSASLLINKQLSPLETSKSFFNFMQTYGMVNTQDPRKLRTGRNILFFLETNIYLVVFGFLYAMPVCHLDEIRFSVQEERRKETQSQTKLIYVLPFRYFVNISDCNAVELEIFFYRVIGKCFFFSQFLSMPLISIAMPSPDRRPDSYTQNLMNFPMHFLPHKVWFLRMVSGTVIPQSDHHRTFTELFRFFKM